MFLQSESSGFAKAEDMEAFLVAHKALKAALKKAGPLGWNTFESLEAKLATTGSSTLKSPTSDPGGQSSAREFTPCWLRAGCVPTLLDFKRMIRILEQKNVEKRNPTEIFEK